MAVVAVEGSLALEQHLCALRDARHAGPAGGSATRVVVGIVGEVDTAVPEKGVHEVQAARTTAQFQAAQLLRGQTAPLRAVVAEPSELRVSGGAEGVTGEPAGGVAMSHGHSHGGGGCRCAAEREEPPEQRGLAYGLYLRIDLERLQCLNESREGSGRGVFKPWEERTDRSKFVESDADEELLFNIPFTGNVKLKGVIIMGEDDDSHPSEMRLYKNIPQMSFDDTEREPEQTFSLNRDITGELEYATKISRFSNVYHLSIHISKNFGADTTKIFYIGLRGEWTELRRHEVTICNYEASANPADHRVHQVTPQTHFIS